MKTASVAYSVADKGQGKWEDWGEKSKIREVSAGSSGLAYILNRNVVNSDWRFNMCGSDVKSVTAGLHPAPRTIRHGLLMTRLLFSNHSL